MSPSITRELALRVLALLFPPVCLACRRVEGIESLPLGLCDRCRRRLEPVGLEPERPRRPAAGSRRSELDRVLSAWSFEPPLDAAIHALKFSRMEFLGSHLAAALHHIFVGALQEIEVVVPIPLHWYRRLRRGYNQAEAIARPLARRLGLPMVRALRRRRLARPQARLGRRDRALNLRLAFAAVECRSPSIAGRHVLLVDDVITTGATLEAAARCLRELQARRVTALTAGRTPGHRGGLKSTTGGL